MVIKSIDSIVNAVPDCSASVARQLLVERSENSSGTTPIFDGTISSMILGYTGGLGAQATAIGLFTGYNSGSVLLGVGAGVSGAVAPLAVKLMKYRRCLGIHV